ncbi:MAG TPA: hypothetical protein VGP62_05165 [Bryobacteraceae bacterium]|nr:hypothetical protein [Bryobacteraceae bacterium]
MIFFNFLVEANPGEGTVVQKAVSRKPPAAAPEGTGWFGGPVDQWKLAGAPGLGAVIGEKRLMDIGDRFQRLRRE